MIDEYPGAKNLCTREYWYTLISRAKEKCVLIGRKATVDQGCRKIAINKRKTFLKELILRELAEKQLAEL
jgi:ATP-dependent exoDNAse (exonuclease V) alpha subunit